MINTIYVIGNGFDRWHELPTEYTDFSKYAGHCEIYDYFDFKKNDQYLWTDFEDDLSTFDSDRFFNYHKNYNIESDSFKLSELYSHIDSLGEETDNVIETIKGDFAGWIDQIDLEKIPPKTAFLPNAYFITFNYTRLLEEIYNIDKSKILHIHGNIKDDYTDIVFGHGKALDIVPEIDQYGEHNDDLIAQAEGIAQSPLCTFIKPVKEIIEKNREIFKSFSDVEKVFVLGHSLNSIDLPYFNEINKITNNAEWLVSYYSKKDLDSHRFALREIKVNEHRIRLLPLMKCCN